MAAPPTADYVFEFYESAVWTEIPYWQSFTVEIGRKFQLDTYRADTCNAEFWFREVDGYLPFLKPDVPVRIYDAARLVTLFYGYIKDLQIDYGMPYDAIAGIGNADRMLINAEGAFAKLGRMSGNGYVLAADDLQSQIDTAEIETGYQIVGFDDAFTVQMGGTTINSTWGDWLARAALTLNNRILSVDDNVKMRSKYDLPTTDYNFDTVNGPLFQRYAAIDFRSLADNFYTQIIVEPETASSASAEIGAAPFRTYQVNTLNATTAQAQDFADYLLANYSSGAFQPASITATSEQQDPTTGFYLDNLGGQEPGFPDFYTQELVGYQTNVNFRSTSYPVIIEGLTISGTPDSQTFTYYLSGADLNAYLILDDDNFGKLDQNKLGY